MIANLKTSIDSALAAEVALRPVREGEVQVYVPFELPDGDGLVVHVRDAGEGRLEVTDCAHTLHLALHTDLKRFTEGQRATLLEKIAFDTASKIAMASSSSPRRRPRLALTCSASAKRSWRSQTCGT